MDAKVRDEWVKTVQPVEVRIQGMQTPLFLVPKKFSTGSIGWHLSQKVVLSDTPCQLSLCLTVIGSKPPGMPEDLNGTTVYADGYKQAADLRETAEVTQRAPKTAKAKPAKEEKPS